MDKIEELKKRLPSIQSTVQGLRKESVKSLCGPCPKCGGVDRFVYRTDSERFFCRQCNEKGGDVIDFHAWVENTDIEGLIKKYLNGTNPKNTGKKLKPFEHFELGFPLEKYPYTDAMGTVKYYNCRFKPLNGKKKKDFRQCDPTGLNWKAKGILPKVPYNLPKVTRVNEIFIVEGEKDVNNLGKLNLVGTCNVAGAGNWTENLNEYFRDKDVFLIPDNDVPGRKHIEKIYQNLKGVAASIKIIELPGLPDKGDFSDWIDQYEDIHKAGERFAIMIDGAPPYISTLENLDSSETETAQIKIVTLESIASVEINDNPMIEGLVEKKESLIVSAASGTGKSLFVTYIALALGNPPVNGLWGLFQIPHEIKTLIVQSENSFNAFNKRLNKLFNACPEMKAGAMNVFTVKIGHDCRYAGSLTDKNFQNFLTDSLLSINAENLILDPLISYHGEDENDNSAMRRSLDCLSSVCDQANASVILCHHYNRNNLTRGAASIRDWASNMLLMDFERKIGSSTILKITHDKSRNYETQPDFYLERTPDLQFLRCEKPGKQSEQIEAVIKALTEMGGRVDSQTPLKNAVMVELNCSETTARRAIKQTLELRKMLIIPSERIGQPNSYALPSET